jgi:hypothetical protein
MREGALSVQHVDSKEQEEQQQDDLGILKYAELAAEPSCQCRRKSGEKYGVKEQVRDDGKPQPYKRRDVMAACVKYHHVSPNLRQCLDHGVLIRGYMSA